MWKNLDNKDKLIDIKTINFNGKNDWTFTELILLDTNSGYIPVIIKNINTSSQYCFEKSQFDYCIDNEIYSQITLGEIISNLLEIFDKREFCQIICKMN